jgi:hypothetical protein
LIDVLLKTYNHHRPHRSLPHQATPTTPLRDPAQSPPRPHPRRRDHDRIRHDRVEKSGTVTLRVHGKLRHIGVGRTHSRTHVILLVQDLDVRVVNAVTGELLRELTINPDRDYQPRNSKRSEPPVRVRIFTISCEITSVGLTGFEPATP